MIWTGRESRELMFGLLENFVIEHKESFVGEYIIDDLMKLVRTRTGKIEAQKGFHDDNIMSFLMCLYLYYYGNNLSRYGFVRGAVKEEDMNKGLIQGESVFDYLSDTDKQNLGIADASSFDVNSIDITSMIEGKNKGFITTQELQKALNDMDNADVGLTPPAQMRNPLASMDPYQMKIYQEMQQAQRESEAFNQRMNFASSYRNMNDDYSDVNDGFDPGLFSELND